MALGLSMLMPSPARAQNACRVVEVEVPPLTVRVDARAPLIVFFRDPAGIPCQREPAYTATSSNPGVARLEGQPGTYMVVGQAEGLAAITVRTGTGRTMMSGSGPVAVHVAVPSADSVGVGARVQRGSRIEGRLTSGDRRLADNSRYQAYLFEGRVGDSVTVDVMSTEFDAFVLIQDAQGERLASDDDSGEGLNARLTYTFPHTGIFRIVVNTYREGGLGAYTLWIH